MYKHLFLLFTLPLLSPILYAQVVTFNDLRDEKIYKAIKSENLYWMVENLNHITSTGSFCYDNNEQNCNLYGRLYSFEVAKNVCPQEWRLPTFEEWKKVKAPYYRGKIKELKSKEYWHFPGTNSTHFNFLPAGAKAKNGDFNGLGKRTFFWMTDGNKAVYATIQEDLTHSEYARGDYGFSVRCVIDEQHFKASTTKTNPNSKALSYDQKVEKELSLFCKTFKNITEPISKSATSYDGVYSFSSRKIFEVPANDASSAHYVYNTNNTFWRYPKIRFSLTKNIGTIESPVKFVLKGSDFSDENMGHLILTSLENIKLSPTKYFHSGGDSWWEEDYAFIPEYDTNNKNYKELKFKKRRVADNHYEIVIASELEKGQEYVFSCNSKMWIFKIQ